MNRPRRLAYFTAVNIDGNSEHSISRDQFNDKWFLDPRLSPSDQLENDAYKGTWNVLDRGHLVRRLDPVWGNSFADAKLAHDDSFHWSNCSPQHQNFNRLKGLWNKLEDYILKNGNTRNLRVSVFSGPVFRDDDPILVVPSGTEVELPLEFWKIVAMVTPEGKLSATGYTISQEMLIDGFLDDVESEEFVFGEFKGTQVTIQEIEELTGLTFRILRDHDPLQTQVEGVGLPRRPLVSLDSIVL